jgi:Holliday junction resolvasome RuvABC endonuclease subunit
MTEYVWGVDVAVSHLAFAFASLDDRRVHVESLITRTTEREGARLGLLDRQVRIYARQRAGGRQPACVWVEQASGARVNPQLCYSVGVIQAALFEALACPVWTIPSGTWKKRALGWGNATKPQVAQYVTDSGYRFDGQDEADAICIAVAGRAMFQARSWEATAA